MKTKTLEFYWHLHHEIILEALTEPLKNRIKYIKENKPEDEIELRLRLIKPVKGKLPVGIIKAGATYDKARDDYRKARDDYNKARATYDKVRDAYYKARATYYKTWDDYNKTWDDYDKAVKDNMPALEKLHKIECKKCPWNGKTIFTKKNG